MVLVEDYEKVNRCKLWLTKTKSSESLQMISLSVFSNAVEIREAVRVMKMNTSAHTSAAGGSYLDGGVLSFVPIIINYLNIGNRTHCCTFWHILTTLQSSVEVFNIYLRHAG